MSDENEISRRLLLGTTIAASTTLAGCSGSGGDEAGEITDTETNTETTTPTEAPTETPTEEPTTVDNFTYPAGASQDGITPSELFSTHRGSIVDAGSATVTVDQSTDREDFTSSVSLTNTYSADGILQIEEDNDLTETLWSSSSEDIGYVKMDTGFDRKYRIDNEVPRTEEFLKLPMFEHILSGAEWSEAKEIVETDGGEPSVVYDASGIASEENLRRVLFGDTVTEFEANISVTEDGYLNEVSYDITAERDSGTVQQQTTTTVEMLGETTVEEPSWATTAEGDGVRFNASRSEDGRAILLELANGDVSSGADIHLSSNRFGSARLPQAISAGDTIYISFSESGELRVGINEMPSDATELGDFAFVGLRSGQFELFEQNIR